MRYKINEVNYAEYLVNDINFYNYLVLLIVFICTCDTDDFQHIILLTL